MQSDFSRINAPKDKVHLESSHRSLHNFEMRIIKFFEDRIVKMEPGWIFKKGKKEKIMVACLDINLEQLRESGLLESYRQEHNELKHSFSLNGKISSWIPDEKFDAALSGEPLLSFTPDDVKNFMKYGYQKIKATVYKNGMITFNKRSYYVATGADNFSRHKSTTVYISDLRASPEYFASYWYLSQKYFFMKISDFRVQSSKRLGRSPEFNRLCNCSAS